MLIRKKLWLAGVTLLLGAVLCIFLLTRYLAEPRLYQQAQDSAQLRVEGIAAEIHGVLQATASLTRSMAALAATLPLDETTFSAHLRDLVDEFGNGAIAGGGIWPEPRRLDPARERASLFWARDAQGKLQLLNDYNDPAGSGYHNEGWYSIGRTLAPGQCAWSEAYADPVSGTPMVTCTVAIRRQGEFWGVATIDLMLSGLGKLLQGHRELAQAYPFVVDQTGTMVAVPGLRPQSLNMKSLDELAAADSSLAPLKSLLEAGRTGVTVPSGVVPSDQALMVLTTLEDQRWKVGILLPQSVALETMSALSAMLYLSLVPLIMVFVLVMIVFGRQIIGWLEETTAQVRSLVNGQISTRLTVSRDDEVGRLRRAVNDYADYLGGILNNIGTEAGAIREGADGLNGLSDTLTRRAHAQLDENNTLATAVSEMASSAKEVAQNTATAAQTASEARVVVDQGQRVVTENSEAISRLADALSNASQVIERLATDSQQVGAVLAVIKAISEQTNLLALNAAIEAARAGEQGRGFAVVADEVRTLAGRTQASASEIEQMIIQLQNAAGSGVEVIENSRELSRQSIERAQEARDSFADIVSAFSNIEGRTATIATAVEEQTRVAQEIHQLAERIRSLSEQNAQDASHLNDMSRDYTAVAQRLHAISRN